MVHEHLQWGTSIRTRGRFMNAFCITGVLGCHWSGLHVENRRALRVLWLAGLPAIAMHSSSQHLRLSKWDSILRLFSGISEISLLEHSFEACSEEFVDSWLAF